MRITFLHKTANFSGGNRVVASYATRLKARGHHVCVVTGREPRPRPLRYALARLRGVPVDWAPSGASWLDDLDVEHRVLDRARPIEAGDVPDADVIVATWWETAQWISSFPPPKGAKAYFLQGVEWTIRGMPVETVRQTWRLPMHKIVVAEFMRRIAEEEFGDGDVSYVPNAVDRALFDAPPRGKQGAPTVGFMDVGLSHEKGGDVVRAALARAKELEPSLRGVCFGRRLPPPELRPPSWVEYVVDPPPPVLAATYARADVWVHGSRAEGFGLPILEAMACRTPVVATPAGAAPELVASGGGVLLPPEDAEAMAQAIVDVARLGASAWRARSDAAYARATGYGLDDATDRMEAALERAVAKGRDRSFAPATGGIGTPEALRRVPGLLEARGTGSRGAAALGLRDVFDPDTLAALQALGRSAERTVAADGELQPVAGDGELLSEVWRALSRPEVVSVLEAEVGGRLLRDPQRRDEGLFLVGLTATSVSEGPGALADPPLVRRLSLAVGLAGRGCAVELWDPTVRTRTVLPLTPNQGHAFRAGPGFPVAFRSAEPPPSAEVVASAADPGTRPRPVRPEGRSGARSRPPLVYVAHYYEADPRPEAERPPEVSRTFARPDAPLAQRVATAADRWARRWRAEARRGADRLHERVLGFR